MRNGRVLFGFLILILWLVYTFTSSKENKNEQHIFVETRGDLKPSLIQVEFGHYSRSSQSDSALVKTGLNKVIFQNNKAQHFKVNQKNRDFYVLYADSHYSIFRHPLTKKNKNSSVIYDYYFLIYKEEEEDKYLINFLIINHKTRAIEYKVYGTVMQEVAKAESNIWGL